MHIYTHVYIYIYIQRYVTSSSAGGCGVVQGAGAALATQHCKYNAANTKENERQRQRYRARGRERGTSPHSLRNKRASVNCEEGPDHTLVNPRTTQGRERHTRRGHQRPTNKQMISVHTSKVCEFTSMSASSWLQETGNQEWMLTFAPASNESMFTFTSVSESFKREATSFWC